MSSKNNKPVNNPANKDKKTQIASTSDANKSASNKAEQNNKAAVDSNTSISNSANNDNKSPANKPTVSQSTSSTENNSRNTSAKPVPPNANTTSVAPSKPANSGVTNKEQVKKPADHSADKKAANTSAHNKENNTPPPPSKPSAAKQSPLPLIISLLALGVGGYALYNSMQQPQANSGEVQKLQEQVSQLQNALADKTDKGDLSTLDQNIQNLKEQLNELKAAPAGGIDEAQIRALISKQVDQAKKSFKPQPQQAAQTGLDKEQVSTMIKEALVSNSADAAGNAQPAIDFSSEINTIKQNKADIEQYLQQIKQEGESLKSSLTQAAEQAKSSLNDSISQAEQKITAADQQPIVYPLINALTLAEVASNARQFGVASQYLHQAKISFDDLHLNQEPYAKFAGKIEELAQKTAALAKQQNSQQEIDNIINNVNSWPFISTDPENVLDHQAADKPTSSWKDDIKSIGNSILSSTVTITKNDAAGLTWVNENPHLQQIIRENVRLDLAMVRNALLIGDQERAQQIAATLKEQVAHYFDTDAGQVKQAMSKLGELTQQQSDKPDIAALIQSIQQAG